jgi:hypothetical protein
LLLPLCHLFIGLSLGLLLYAWLKEEWVILAVALGAILPDLIDKPLGHLLLNETLDNGRIFFHGLFAIGVFVAGSIAARRTRYSILFAALAVGILSHQLLDAMWLDPVSWYFPLLGPYIPGQYPDYLISSIWREITSPTEWMFFLLLASMIFTIYDWVRERFSVSVRQCLGAAARSILRVGPLMLAAAGLIILFISTITTYQDLEELTEGVTLGTVCILGSLFLYWWYPSVANRLWEDGQENSIIK